MGPLVIQTFCMFYYNTLSPESLDSDVDEHGSGCGNYSQRLCSEFCNNSFLLTSLESLKVLKEKVGS